MNKYIVKIIANILYAIVIGLIIKHLSYEIAIIVLLIQINVELILKGDSDER